ncbi:MAG: helix-turn-helix domain-containing protein [Gaiellaceae bacterium]
MAARGPKSERIALSIEEAAAALSISRDSFERHVMAEVGLVQVGRRVIVPRRELERWLERHSTTPLIAEIEEARRRVSGQSAPGRR